MKRLTGLIFSAAFIGGLLSTTSCSDDPPIKPKLSFGESKITVNEADGTIEIEVSLDRPALEDYTIDYELGGTATDNEVDPDFADYAINEDNFDYGEVEIAKGESSGIITIDLFSDFELEDPETIEIKILEVDSEQIEITRDDDIEITIEQEDCLAVILNWTYSTVDMDLVLWAENSSGALEITNFMSASESYQGPEFFILPNVIDDGKYGVSCNYYATTVNPASGLNPMNFTLTYRPLTNGTFGTSIIKNGAYDEGNINPWFESKVNPKLAATFDKSGNSYTNFSDILINVNSTGSRLSNESLSNVITNRLDGTRLKVKDYQSFFKK